MYMKLSYAVKMWNLNIATQVLYKKQVCKQSSNVSIQGNKDFYLFKWEHDV